MEKALLMILLLNVGITISAQFVAKMEVKEEIPGICDKNEVYALLSSFKGQVQAVCPVTKDSLLKRLNSEVRFVKENPNFNDEGMIGLIINCKGELVKCQMDNKTQSPELDKQIEAVFNSLGTWKAGKLNKREVDTSRLFSFKIKDSVFTFDK